MCTRPAAHISYLQSNGILLLRSFTSSNGNPLQTGWNFNEGIQLRRQKWFANIFAQPQHPLYKKSEEKPLAY